MSDKSERKIFVDTIKIQDIVLVSTVALYVLGFLVTNIYLGSLGVFSFELFRAKFVSAGLLFVIFVIPPVYFASLLRSRLHHSEKKTFWPLLRIFVQISVVAIIGIFFINLIFSQAFGFKRLPLGMPLVSPPIPISEILSTSDLAIFLLVFIAAVLFYLVKAIRGLLSILWSRQPFLPTAIKSVKGFIQSFKFPKLLVEAMVNSIYATFLLVFGRLVQSRAEIPIYSSPDWNRFFIVSAIYYLFFAAFVLLPFFPYESESSNTQETPVVPTRIVLSVVFALGLSFVLLTYSTGIYPLLPQQVGGGKPIEVGLTTTDSSTLEFEPNEAQRVFLLDRSAESLLLFVIETNATNFQVVEINSSEIASINYIREP